MDEIKCEFKTKGSNVSLEKVWFNGELKSRTFTVIK